MWKMGRWSDHENPSRGDARLFYVSGFPEQIGFPARGRFQAFSFVVEQTYVSKNDPEVSGSARGASPTY